MLNINRKNRRKRHTAPEPSKLSLELELGEHGDEDIIEVAWSIAPHAENNDVHGGWSVASSSGQQHIMEVLPEACDIRSCEFADSLDF